MYLALIRLPRKIQFTQYIQAVNLPKTCESAENIDVVTMGNGAISDYTGISDQLHFAVMKTIPLYECRKVFPMLLLRKSVICAQNSMYPQSICNGDSGSALVTKSGGILIGVSCIGRYGNIF